MKQKLFVFVISLRLTFNRREGKMSKKNGITYTDCHNTRKHPNGEVWHQSDNSGEKRKRCPLCNGKTYIGKRNKGANNLKSAPAGFY